MSDELKDCPFCGCKATFVKHSAGMPGTQGFDKWDAAACKHCRATVGACDRRFRSRDDAREAWNRRVPAEPAPASTYPMCERKTNDIITRDGYAKTGYVLKKDGAQICVSDGGAVAWFTPGQWQWLMFNRDHVPFQWPAPVAARELDVEAERREQPSKMLDAQLRYIFELEQRVVQLEAEAKAAAPVSTEQAGDAWISVEDRLPEDCAFVAIFDPENEAMPVRTAQWLAGSCTFESELGWLAKDEVSHWMHLPAVPSPNNSPVGAKEQDK